MGEEKNCQVELTHIIGIVTRDGIGVDLPLADIHLLLRFLLRAQLLWVVHPETGEVVSGGDATCTMEQEIGLVLGANKPSIVPGSSIQASKVHPVKRLMVPGS